MSKFLQPGFNNIEIFSRVSSSVYETEVNAACGEPFNLCSSLWKARVNLLL